MKITIKKAMIPAFGLLIFFGTVLPLYVEGKSHEIPSHQDLMNSMQIMSISEEIKAPDFVLQNLQGNSVRLSELRGKVVLVNFWTTW